MTFEPSEHRKLSWCWIDKTYRTVQNRFIRASNQKRLVPIIQINSIGSTHMLPRLWGLCAVLLSRRWSVIEMWSAGLGIFTEWAVFQHPASVACTHWMGVCVNKRFSPMMFSDACIPWRIGMVKHRIIRWYRITWMYPVYLFASTWWNHDKHYHNGAVYYD